METSAFDRGVEMKTRKMVSLCVVALFLVALCRLGANAAVTGDCVNCHTMHNSQAGEVQTEDKDGNPLETAQLNLLVSDCLGCHSNMTSTATIIPIGSGDTSRVPIVLTADEPVYPPDGSSSSVLAGGSFYWVAQGDDSKGHNVFGIRANPVDAALAKAPGGTVNCDPCHATLASEESGGCRGCHFPAHHVDDGNATDAADSGDGWYRFLTGASMTAYRDSTKTRMELLALNGVSGLEDPDWEQNPAAAHNVYKGTTVRYASADGNGNVRYNSIGAFCSGCHSDFHHKKSDDGGMEESGVWIRHPSDVLLPDTAEYAGYSYTSLAPVAYDDVAAETNAVVTCLSCHRPHGSPYPDMLRWDYQNDCIAGTTDSEENPCGCFSCHTEKD